MRKTMIQFVQTGEYRSRTIRISRFVNGLESTGNGFPFLISILDSFGAYPQMSDQEFISLTKASYDARVEALKSHLLQTFPWLSANDFTGASNGVDNDTCTPGHVVSSGSISITQETEIRIFFDSSGSMNTALAPLLEMKNTLLKNSLLHFYNNDPALYDQRVYVSSDASERTFKFLNNNGLAMTKPTLILVFQDEANPNYHTSTSITTPTTMFQSDIAALRATIGGLAPNRYRGAIFQVTRSAGEGYQFKNLIQAVQNGTGNYTAGLNLSDRPEIAYQYDVKNNETPQYYMDVVLLKMRELGYKI
jgi:hypothetical protein